MYLKEIVASGFKSFADKIDIKLDNKITCIVGPNGSGKSNVVDACRWVLGEQSVKNLRGSSSMSDIIFSGSKSRSALNVATVELIFDNSDKYINLNYDEISIKRKAYRTGENEYFLNGERVRLKDITDMLLDTGIGKSSFNIIGQGEVDKILSGSSISAREIVEEAAGVVKYKKRKEEAVKKLDKTNINLDRVEDIIRELSMRVEPLKAQSDKAKKYKENKDALEEIEIALLAYDIYDLSENKKTLEDKKKKMEEELAIDAASHSKGDTLLTKYNSKIDELNNKLSLLNNKLLETIKELSSINSERLLLEEKEKNKDKSKDEESLKEELLKESDLNNKKNILLKDIDSINEEINTHSEDVISLNKEKDNVKEKMNIKRSSFSKTEQDIITISKKISSIEEEIESFDFLPITIRKVLNNKNLSGIINIFGNLISTDNKYEVALSVATSASKNFVITETMEDSKRAVEYLKNEHLGRATFFPLDTIKARYIDANTINALEGDPDFLGTLDNLVSYDKRYEGIVKNQLGQILISPDIDSSNRLSRKVGRRYRVISLEGDTFNVGGSLTGGSLKKKGSTINLKQELGLLKDNLKEKEEEKEKVQKEINNLSVSLTDVNSKYYDLKGREDNLREKLKNKQNELENINNSLNNSSVVINSLRKVIKSDSSVELEKLLNKYNDINANKINIEKDIENINKEIDEVKLKIDEEEGKYKISNANMHNLEKNINEFALKINSIDNKLDIALNSLNEYGITYEKARNDYPLMMDADLARSKVASYKKELKEIGMVNLDSIAEYEEVKTRYDFLCSQKDDLLGAINTLHDIMNEMDSVIEEEFTKTYYELNTEFDKVFKELFGGGRAGLELDDKENMLTTGISIMASPPGKKLKGVSLLSGGEKTLTAISLLFAILNIRPVPFCIFDEVEAALDEANVDTFGKYLGHYKNKTQFLIITHKKKTMEYADTLYGITMQESGVSKLVSVKLNEKTVK